MRDIVPINKGNYSMDTPEREARFESFRGEGWADKYAEYRRNWRLFPIRQFVAEYPLLVDIELSSICNLRCPMCYTITDQFKKKVNTTLMDWGLYAKIIDEIGGKVPAIRLSLRGEATLHKRFVDCIRYAKEKGIKEVSTLTNGGTLNLDFFKKMVEAGMDWITISIDGTGKTYERIRRPLRFQDLLSKIREIRRFKDENGIHRPVIKVQSIWPAIEEDPKAYYDTFASYVDLVAFNPLIDYLSKDDQIEYVDEFICPQQYQRLVIGADGLVMKCSNDEENIEVVGNMNYETIHSVWHGQKMKAIRELQKQPQGFLLSDVCRKCYLPRETRDETYNIGNITFLVKNYTNRSQVVGH